MATDTIDTRSAHVRGITVTTLATVAGVAAALASTAFASGATDSVAVYVLAGAVLVQFPILQVLGIDVEEFSAKDYLYVGFMTFSLWFVCWAILLTVNASIAV